MNRKFNIAALFVFSCTLAACSETGKRIENADSVSEMATQDTAVLYDNDRAWTVTSYEAQPLIEEPELRDAGVEVRGTDTLRVYAMEQDVMFGTDKAMIRAEGEDKLKKISESIKKMKDQDRMQITVYGHTDSRASEAYNKELGKERAQAVADYLSGKGGFDKSRITAKSMGETKPEATNETAAGRQQNRRVEIVVSYM